MTTILLVRHGETDWNRGHRWQGHSDTPLNDDGRRQAAELADRLSGVDAIYSSDLGRARETAEIVGARLGLPVRTDARLRELSFGDWEGLRSDEIEARYPDAYRRWAAYESHPESGESYDELAERVLAALRDIARAHEGERVLVVTHGGPIRAVQAHLRGIEQLQARRVVRSVGNCSLAEIAVRGDAIVRVD